MTSWLQSELSPQMSGLVQCPLKHVHILEGNGNLDPT